jgi:hypothetical protein
MGLLALNGSSDLFRSVLRSHVYDIPLTFRIGAAQTAMAFI